MAKSNTDQLLENNLQYASGQALHKSAYPGKQPIQPAKRVAVVACMDARLDVADLDEALEFAALIPGAKTGSVEVRPIVDFGARDAEAVAAGSVALD